MSLQIVTILLVGIITGSWGDFTADQLRLFNNLTASYHPFVRPVKNAGEVVTVTFGLNVLTIDEVDEAKQTISLHLWMLMKWNDSFLTWNPGDYGGIEQLNLPMDRLWSPDIVLYNGQLANFERMMTMAVVAHTGQVMWVPPSQVTATCPMDLSHFPFDKHTCQLKYGSWTYSANEVDLELGHSGSSVGKETGEWEVVGELKTGRNANKYPCCDEVYPDVTTEITVKRRHAYIVHLFLAPAVMVALLLPALFTLPPDSHSKTTLGAAIMISVVLLLMMLENFIPAAHPTVPLIGRYYLACIILTAISVAASCLVTDIWSKGTINLAMPAFLASVLTTVCRFLLLDQERFMPNDDTVAKLERCLVEETSNAGNLQKQTDERENVRKTYSRLVQAAQWRLLAAFLDRALALVLLLVVIITTIAMMA